MNQSKILSNNLANNFLKKYINKDYEYPFAVLLKGKWGSGKTYFKDKFVDSILSNKKIKIIDISLFGLQNTSSIDEKIFETLHPVLGNKYTKLATNFLKGAVRLGTSIDLNDNNEDDTRISANLNNIKLPDFFKKDSSKNIIFIFDDLERTKIPINDLLGYINNLVEILKYKVILIANEEEIIKDNNKEYMRFKEKIIGKTFNIQYDINKVLNHYLKENIFSKKKKQLIIKIFKESDTNNIRFLRQFIIDYKYFKDNCRKKIDNEDFKILFALYIEIKLNSFHFNDFIKYSYINQKNLSDSELEKFNQNKTNVDISLYSKYKIKKNSVKLDKIKNIFINYFH